MTEVVPGTLALRRGGRKGVAFSFQRGPVHSFICSEVIFSSAGWGILSCHLQPEHFLFSVAGAFFHLQRESFSFQRGRGILSSAAGAFSRQRGRGILSSVRYRSIC